MRPGHNGESGPWDVEKCRYRDKKGWGKEGWKGMEEERSVSAKRMDGGKNKCRYGEGESGGGREVDGSVGLEGERVLKKDPRTAPQTFCRTSEKHSYTIIE